MANSNLSIEQVRLIQLSVQGLLHIPAIPATKADVLAAIRRMGVLQIDTISVVARSPFFVLFSRLGGYNPAWLDELLEEKAIFEYWAHAACFIPMEEYLLFRRFMLEGTRSYFEQEWIEQNQDTLTHVLNSVREKGPQRSADFVSKKESGGWWNLKLEKWALEYWFFMGELMIARRANFQRVYELTERMIPGLDDLQLPEMDEIYHTLILKSIQALGVVLPGWVADYYRLKKKPVAGMLQEMVKTGKLLKVEIEGWDEPGLYLPSQQPLIDSARNGELTANHTTLLSPFDPLTWDRNRVRQLFNFDFMIQSYTPKEKRSFGYFPLPILHRGALVGRLDAKAHRKQGFFEIKGLYLEKDVLPTGELVKDLAIAIQKCAIWHLTPSVILGENVPVEIKDLLQCYFSKCEKI